MLSKTDIDPFGELPPPSEEKTPNSELVHHHWLQIKTMHEMIDSVEKMNKTVDDEKKVNTDSLIEQILIVQDLMGKAYDNT